MTNITPIMIVASFAAAVPVAVDTAFTSTIRQTQYLRTGRDTGKGSPMSQSYVIEVGDDQIGLVLRDSGEREFRFHASSPAYQPLDGRRFAAPRSPRGSTLAPRSGAVAPASAAAFAQSGTLTASDSVHHSSPRRDHSPGWRLIAGRCSDAPAIFMRAECRRR